MPRRARPGRRPGESYEERSERRQENRERLRCRDNVTTCRHPARPAQRPELSPRQNEFIRRRNLAAEAGDTLPGQEPEARTPLEPSPSILLQVTPAPRHGSELSLLQPPLEHRHPSQNTAKMQIVQTKMQIVQTKVCISPQSAESGVGTQPPPCSSPVCPALNHVEISLPFLPVQLHLFAARLQFCTCTDFFNPC